MLGLSKLVPIAIAVVVLLALVTTSYRQTIFAYPSGGGSYIVSRENLGENPALIAGASLMVDYILTVAVSVSAGVAAIISIPQFEGLAKHRVAVCLAIILIITLANLRGIKESGQLFAFPTYAYIVIVSAMIFLGLTKTWFGWFGGIHPIPFNPNKALPGPEGVRRNAEPVHPLARASRRARSRSPASRPSPTASPRSGGRNRRTRRPPSRGWRRSSARCSSASRCSRTTCIRTRATW